MRETRGVVSAESERFWLRAWQSRFALGAASAFAVVLAAGFVFLRFAGGPGTVSPGFVVQPDSNVGAPTRTPSIAQNERPGGAGERSDPFDLDGFGGFGGFGARSVSSGSPSPLGFDAFGEDALFEADSLGYRPITARKDYQRIRQLEQQIEILRKELDNCNLGRGE